MSKIVVLDGHPNPGSLCAGLAETYAREAALGGHDVRRLRVASLPLSFAAPDYSGDDEGAARWVAEAQEILAWADHWVIVAPMWWGGVPAALKAFLDQTLLPGFAFRYRPRGAGWDKLLKGRTARLILTSDTPHIVFRWLWGWPLVRQFKTQILGFCGITPLRTTLIGPVRPSDANRRAKWLAEIARLAQAGN